MVKKVLSICLSMTVISIYIAFSIPSTTYACSCAETPSVEEDLAKKTAIFSGKVIQISAENNSSNKSTADQIAVTFEVESAWKGVDESQVIVYTAVSSASCGYETFSLNNEYLIYAYGDKHKLGTGFCERTKPLVAAKEDLAILGIGQKPNQQVNLLSDSVLTSDENLLQNVKGDRITLFSMIAAGIIIVAVYLMRRFIFK
jgi:hypothetical protein